jgi:hypothetical protein
MPFFHELLVGLVVTTFFKGSFGKRGNSSGDSGGRQSGPGFAIKIEAKK